MYNNFEISLVVFQLNNTTYHAITYLIHSIFFHFFFIPLTISTFYLLYIFCFIHYSTSGKTFFHLKKGKGRSQDFDFK